MILKLVILRRNFNLVWRLVGINVLFSIALYGCFIIAALINNAVYPYPSVLYDPNYEGYYRAIIPGIVLLLVYGGWLTWQMRIHAIFNHPSSQVRL